MCSQGLTQQNNRGSCPLLRLSVVATCQPIIISKCQSITLSECHHHLAVPAHQHPPAPAQAPLLQVSLVIYVFHHLILGQGLGRALIAVLFYDIGKDCRLQNQGRTRWEG